MRKLRPTTPHPRNPPPTRKWPKSAENFKKENCRNCPPTPRHTFTDPQKEIPGQMRTTFYKNPTVYNIIYNITYITYKIYSNLQDKRKQFLQRTINFYKPTYKPKFNLQLHPGGRTKGKCIFFLSHNSRAYLQNKIHYKEV